MTISKQEARNVSPSPYFDLIRRNASHQSVNDYQRVIDLKAHYKKLHSIKTLEKSEKSKEGAIKSDIFISGIKNFR